MAVTFHSIKCPDCGASLHIEEGRAQLFCSFCGAKITAAVEHAPGERTADAAEAERTPEETAKRRVIIGIALVLAAILMIVVIRSAIKALKLPGILLIAAAVCAVVILWKKKGAKADGDTRIKVPSAVSDYEWKNYATVEAVFKNAGFTMSNVFRSTI